MLGEREPLFFFVFGLFPRETLVGLGQAAVLGSDLPTELWVMRRCTF